MTFGCTDRMVDLLGTHRAVTACTIQTQLDTGLNLQPAPGTEDRFFVDDLYFHSANAWMTCIRNLNESIRARGTHHVLHG